MRTIYILLTILLYVPWGGAQTIVEVVPIEKDQGLHDRNVDRIIRDDNGFFIITMLNNIQRYDGKDFVDIDPSTINRAGHKVRDVTQLKKLEDGTIVFLIDESQYLFYLSPRSNTVQEAPLNGMPIVENGHLYYLKSDLDKTNPSYHLNTGSLKEGQIVTTSTIPVSIPFKVDAIAKLDDEYYLQGPDRIIHRIIDGRIETLDTKGRLIQRANGIYVFDYASIYKLTGSKISKVVDLPDRSFECSILKLDQNDNIVSAYQGRPRHHDRLYVLDKNDSLHQMPSIVDINTTFKDFHTDDAFYRWMIGGYNGIRVVNLLRDGSRIVHKSSRTKKGEFGLIITGLASNDDEVVFAKELQGIYKCTDTEAGFEALFQKQMDQGLFEHMSKLYFHAPSAAYYAHAFRYDGKSDIYKFSTDGAHSEVHKVPIKLNDIYVQSEDNIILAGYVDDTTTGVLATYNPINKEYKEIRQSTPQLRSIYYDAPTQTFWIGTHAGLLVLDQDLVEVGRLSSSSEGARHLPSDHVVMSNRFGNRILAGTYGGGLFIIDPISMTNVGHIDTESGLSDNSAIGIIPDDMGNCWITTFNGVNVLDKDFNIICKLYEHDGLPNREFNSKAITKDINGTIYAGTLNGVSVLDPRKVLNWKKSHGIEINSVLGYKNNNVDQLSTTSPLVLRESYDSIAIGYKLPDYHVYPYVKEMIDLEVAGHGIQYDIDDQIITLKNIPKGKSSIQLSPAGQKKQLRFNIKRTVNYNRWIVILSSILIIGLLATFISGRIIQNAKNQENEKTALNKKISDLRLSSLQSQMNPHFIFNALGSVQYFIQTHDTEKADEYLSNFAMLMRSILESSKSKYIRFNEELRLLELYIGLEKVRFDEVFDYEIKVDVNVDTEIHLPPMILQPFIENAINHGLYNLKDRNGKLTVHFASPAEDKLIVTITDNGVGRKKAEQLRMKKHKPRGMQIVQERLETINGSKELTISTKTIDLFENEKPSGTQVVISIDAFYD